MKKAPTQMNEQRLSFVSSEQNYTPTKPPSKIKRVTDRLMQGSLNFITAQQEVNDRSLHSTVSELQRDYGIEVHRKRVKQAGYKGIPTTCCEYRILPNQYEKAREAMKRMK